MSPMNLSSETPTPASRYPAGLSRKHKSAGQLKQSAMHTGRPNSNRGKNRNKRNQYPAPSIDHHSRPIPNRPAPSTNPVIRIKELSSLEELLQQAGYKDTRVYTPDADKIRRIKTTFEDDEAEELNDLYGTFGLQRESALESIKEHRIPRITEPTIPFRSSSAILRDLALQDMKHTDKDVASTSPAEPSSWWEGGMAAIGRAAKAVIEQSPPPKDDSDKGDVLSTTHGMLGRKIKSNVELRSGARLAADESAQEQRPPTRSAVSDLFREESPQLAGSHTAFATPSRTSIAFDLPPPQALDDEAFGYSPLPDGYEAQSDEDSGVFEVNSLDRDSFEYVGDHHGAEHEEDSEEAQAVERDLDFFTSLRSSVSHDINQDLGRRVMAGACEYDEDLESPPATVAPLPLVGEEPIAGSSADRRLPDTPITEAPARAPKYADRATKLRIAKSTPVLTSATSATSWLDSFRYAFGGQSGDHQPSPTASPASRARTGPLPITPAALAAPSLVTKSSVLCDSASDGAIDLPPVKTVIPAQSRMASTVPLRLRPSIARLKQAVFATAPAVPVSDAAPTLSPRLDWDSQGEHYAGWNWSTRKTRPSPAHLPPTSPEATEAPEATGGFIKGSIDYTKSFFYKPATPPRRPIADSTRPSPTTDAAAAPQLRARRSIKSLKAALLLPVVPTPPVPAVPARYSRLGPHGTQTPPRSSSGLSLDPPALAIQSPGSWEAGLPPRALVLEGEEWDARDGNVPGDWGRKASRKAGLKKLRKKSPVVDQ